MSEIYHGHAIPAFYEKFGLAIQYLGLNLAESENVQHMGNRGEEREFSLSQFLKELLPSDFRIAAGEVIDLGGASSPALDLMIYDRSKNSPFYSQAREIIPAEALLASFEVKTNLNADEVRRCIKAAAKLKALKPLKRPLSVTTSNGPHRGYRYYHGVFAYRSNLAEGNWAKSEIGRFKKYWDGANRNPVDFIYVLNRGLINVNNSTYIPENTDNGQALISMYFGLYRFLMRENRRRDPAPFFSYATDLNRYWQSIE